MYCINRSGNSDSSANIPFDKNEVMKTLSFFCFIFVSFRFVSFRRRIWLAFCILCIHFVYAVSFSLSNLFSLSLSYYVIVLNWIDWIDCLVACVGRYFFFSSHIFFFISVIAINSLIKLICWYVDCIRKSTSILL